MRNLLKSGLRRLVTQQPKHATGDRRATVLAVAAQKGGVGKTTTAVNLASALARFHGRRVLLVDLDPQGHVNTALRRQVRPGGGDLSSILTSDGDGREVLEITTSTDVPNLHVTPLDPRMGQAEDLIGTRMGKEYLLRDAFKVTRTHYDVIVVDCPPNLGNLTLNGLVAADLVLVPCDPSPLALAGVNALVRTVSTIALRLNPDVDLLGVLLTRVDGRNSTLNETITKEIAALYGENLLLPVRIGISSDLAKAQLDGRDVFGFAEGSRGARHYQDLAEWVDARLISG